MSHADWSGRPSEDSRGLLPKATPSLRGVFPETVSWTPITDRIASHARLPALFPCRRIHRRVQARAARAARTRSPDEGQAVSVSRHSCRYRAIRLFASL